LNLRFPYSCDYRFFLKPVPIITGQNRSALEGWFLAEIALKVNMEKILFDEERIVGIENTANLF
jgi:hypothetical protein